MCTNTIIAVVWTWHMSLLQLDTRMVVQLLLSSCSLHSECKRWWVSLWVDGNLCENKCWCGSYWLMSMMQTLQQRVWRPRQGWFPCSGPAGLLSNCHQVMFPWQDSTLAPCQTCVVAMQGFSPGLLQITCSNTESHTCWKWPSREEWCCLQSEFSYVSYQTNFFFSSWMLWLTSCC